MGEVYRARDTRLGRDIALKLLPADLAGAPDRLARFEREARMVAGLNHPNIVMLHSVEEHGGANFLTMELVEGRNLAELLTPGGLPPAKVLELRSPSPTRWSPRTRRVSCIAISSPRTSCSRATAGSRCSTSGSPSISRTATSASRARATRRFPRSGRCSARCRTWRPSRSAARPSTRAPTCFRSGSSYTSSCPASDRSAGRRRPMSAPRSCATRRRRCQRCHPISRASSSAACRRTRASATRPRSTSATSCAGSSAARPLPRRRPRATTPR